MEPLFERYTAAGWGGIFWPHSFPKTHTEQGQGGGGGREREREATIIASI